MGRDLRYVLPNSLQHVVDVVSQHRHLLCPSEVINERFLGVFGKAQKKYDMVVCAVVVLSSHYHLLLRPRDGAHLAEFMCFLKTNLAKEIGGRLRGWKGHFFDHRYHSTTVSDEAMAQVRVLRYVLSNGTKEFLVDNVRDWPGVHAARHLVDGTPMVGLWYDRSAELAGRNQEGVANREDFVSEQVVELSPLPCWEHLPEAQWRQAVDEIVQDIDREAAQERRTSGKASLGVAAVLAQEPTERPVSIEKSPKRRFHADDPSVLHALLEIWREVVRAFHEASRALRSGRANVTFPEGTFPPAGSFVPFTHVVERARGHPS